MASTKRPVPEWRALEANSKSDLSGKLSEIDISVPSRGCGRTSLHVEKRCICHLLSTLNNNNRLAFPVKVSESERPDFVITINGNPSFGVEITEAIQEDLAQTMTLPEAQHPEAVIDRSLFRWDDPKKSLGEKRNIASRTRLSGPPWEGDDPEKECAQAIKDITFTKTEKLNEGDFQRFGENWLEIYDNVSLAGLEKAEDYIQSALEPYWRESSFSHIFDRIFVERERYIMEFSQSSFHLHRLCNLW
ncbi:MAG: hypothetical protein OXE42_18070 [Gammaproteobacteria bacterium]|nr:hypothetical protein [Gammaproteobacteria bacterium]